MSGITVHVDEARNLVAIEWPNRGGVTVIHGDHCRATHEHVRPPFMTRLEAPKESGS